MKTTKQIAGVPKEPVGKEDYAGCWVEQNQWVKLGLSKNQSRLLKRFAKRCLPPEDRMNANTAWLLLNTALSHIEIMEKLLRGDDRQSARVGNRVGFTSLEGYWEKKATARWNAAN